MNTFMRVILNQKWNLIIIGIRYPSTKLMNLQKLDYFLKENDKSEEEIELSKYFSDLPDRKCRIVKIFYLNGEKTVVVGLFNIKNNK